jgi:hypothetical protein
MKSSSIQGGGLLTLGAVIFAGFAFYEFTKKPGGVLSAQPGQAQRDDGLMQWHDLTLQQAADIAGLQSSTTPNF